MVEPTTHRPNAFRIFISYRHADTRHCAGRVHDALAKRYGEDSVFRDIDAIRPGDDFTKVLGEELGRCQVVLAIIGRDWLAYLRPDDPDDYVRFELATALRRHVVVIPLLVDGALMPRADQLPEALRELAKRNPLSVSDQSWHRDREGLLAALDQRRRDLEADPPEPLLPAAADLSTVSAAPGTDEEAAAPAQRRHVPLGTWIGLAAVIALVAGTVLFWPRGSGDVGQANPTTAPPVRAVSPTSTPAPGPTPSNGPLVLFDDFQAGALGLAKWQTQDVPDPHLIRVEGGLLHLQATQETTSDGLDDNANLIMRNPRPLREIAFTMALDSIGTTSTGGAYAVITDGRGLQHRVGMGPGGDSGTEPVIAQWVCTSPPPSDRCRGYSAYEHPHSPPAKLRQPVAVNITWSPVGSAVQINDAPPTPFNLGSEPIRAFKFHLETDAKRAFDVTFDDVRVAYS